MQWYELISERVSSGLMWPYSHHNDMQIDDYFACKAYADRIDKQLDDLGNDLTWSDYPMVLDLVILLNTYTHSLHGYADWREWNGFTMPERPKYYGLPNKVIFDQIDKGIKGLVDF